MSCPVSPASRALRFRSSASQEDRFRSSGLEAENGAVGGQSGIEQQVVPERGFAQGVVPRQASHGAVHVESLAELLECEPAFPVVQERRRGCGVGREARSENVGELPCGLVVPLGEELEGALASFGRIVAAARHVAKLHRHRVLGALAKHGDDTGDGSVGLGREHERHHAARRAPIVAASRDLADPTLPADKMVAQLLVGAVEAHDVRVGLHSALSGCRDHCDIAGGIAVMRPRFASLRILPDG